MKREMRQHGLPEMHRAGKEILRKVLRDARDARAFDSIFGGEQTVVRRDKMDSVSAMDQAANVVQNMGRSAFWTWYNIEGSIEDVGHCPNYKLILRIFLLPSAGATRPSSRRLSFSLPRRRDWQDKGNNPED
jgi:hypothetical protein